MKPITTTLAQIRAKEPCTKRYTKLVKNLGGVFKYGKDTPIRFSQIFESNGLNDALWCLRTLGDEHSGTVRLLACYFAERSLPIWERYAPDDKQPHNTIETSRRYARGEATLDELRAARYVARAASEAARAVARYDAWTASEAARDAACDVAWGAAWAARATAWAAAWTAVSDTAADTAPDTAPFSAAWVADAAAAGAAERKAQGELLIKYFG